MKISLPPKTDGNRPEIEFSQLVVVGANGSGKTRFGSFIEETNSLITHRVSAQKSLSFPKEVSPKSKARAESEFLYGYYHEEQNEQQQLSHKKLNRWGNNWNTYLLNDYEKLMVLLHTEEYEESLNFKENGGAKPVTKLDRIQLIWEAVLPHRKLIKRAGVIEAMPTGGTEAYNASEMSDGERVIFYLIGEVVCAPENSIIIIDEPEIHIHKSLVKQLFDLIENERQDCAFVYLTHDVDFAFSRLNAKKVWTKSYLGGNVWDYEVLDDITPIPEQLYLEVLGSRNEVIFLEGEASSIDYKLYEHVYPHYTIKPLGSCEKVIQTVKAFNEQNNFHHINSMGIIDRDRRVEEDIVRLVKKNIWVLDVAEAENLLLLEVVVKTIASHMHKDPVAVFNEVKSNLVSFFEKELDSQVLLHYKSILSRKIAELADFKSKDINNAIPEIDGMFGAIDKQAIFDEIRAVFEDAVKTSDYEKILRVFNLKGALIPNSNVCALTDIKNKESYLNQVLSILKRHDEQSKAIADAIDMKIIKSVP